MQAADALAVRREGEVVLMRRAGSCIADLLRERVRGRRIIAFAGPGNNGGDAFAACAELANDADCIVYASASARASEGRNDAEQRARAAGVRIEELPKDPVAARTALMHADYILDGLLGVGARNDTSVFAHIIEACNDNSAPVCALDLPTGIDATSGECATPMVMRATITVALGAIKLGLLLDSAREYVGELYVADIGIQDTDIKASLPKNVPAYHVLTANEFLALLPRRGAHVDKRSSGAPLLVAGSAQFPGAAVLCARAAARAGAGYVTVATPIAAAVSLRMHLVEQVVATFDETDIENSIETLSDVTRHVQAVGIGPGMGLDTTIAAIMQGFVERTTLPLVVDASAFAHLGKHLELVRNRACVFTPHENEFARLSGKGSIVPGTRLERLREFVDRTGITTLLKGNVTLICDGSNVHINPSGTNALATAGTGDVLTGMIATLLAQGLQPIDAARVAAFWHGHVGQLAARERHVGVMAGDLPELFAQAIMFEDQPTYARLVKIF
jgi:hydroxyethylthiazole kinase-like uncharacterized protein yjeF